MATSFAASELRQALSEIPWGYRSHALLPADRARPGEALVEIRLLEDGELVVAGCSDKGWTLIQHTTAHTQRHPDQPFDTLDDLMLVVSPRFEQVRMEKLLEKLASVQDQDEPHKPRWAFDGSGSDDEGGDGSR
ncbi:hypothetical protein JCM8202_005611 [Rhodotorula sphaerocarpa]